MLAAAAMCVCVWWGGGHVGEGLQDYKLMVMGSLSYMTETGMVMTVHCVLSCMHFVARLVSR